MCIRSHSLRLAALGLVSLILTACAPAATPTPNHDKFTQILQRGTLVIATDAAYPPQSEVVADAPRQANTRCTADQYTANQLTGFDIDVAVAIAQQLGVEACFVTPEWGLIIAGDWGDRWDIHIGQMVITGERAEKLYFAQPYSSGASAFYVPHTATYTDLVELEGKRIGVCGGCYSELLLRNQLTLPGQTIASPLHNPQVVAFEYTEDALKAMFNGELEAVLGGDDVTELIAQQNLPIKQLGPAVMYLYTAPAFDRATPLPVESLVHKVSAIIQTMHTEGWLAERTRHYYSSDSYALVAARFDYRDLKQFP